MTGPLLYELSVPALHLAITNQIVMLKKAQKWAQDNGHPDSKLVEARLVPDMFPLRFQLQTMANTTSKLLTRLEILPNLPSVPDDEKTTDELIARLEKSLQQLDEAKQHQAKFEGKEDAKIEFKAGDKMLSFDGVGYVRGFALQNFFFHHTIAFAIYRTQGIDVGKRIYLEGLDQPIVLPESGKN